MNLARFSSFWFSPRTGGLLAMVLAAAALGWWLGRRPAASAPPPVSISAAPPRPPALSTARSKLPAEVQSWISEIEAEQLPSAQAAAAARLAARLTREEWPVLLRHLERFASPFVRAALEAAVLRRWAAADPAGAAEWGLRHHPALAAAAAAEWVRQDPQAAQAWFAGLTQRQRAEGFVQEEFYVALVQRDPDACYEMMLAQAREMELKLDWVQKEIVEASPERALAFAERLPSGDLRKSFREEVARAYGKRDPLAAIAWAQQQPDAEKMLVSVFQQFKTQPAKQIGALATLTPEQQKRIHDETWPWWEHGDPVAMLDVLRDAPAGLTEESRKKLTARAIESFISRYDPPEVARQLEADWKDFAGMWERQVAAKWSSRDPEAARVWIETLPPGEARDKAWKTYEEAKQRQEQVKENDPVSSVVRMMSRTPSGRWQPDGSLLQPLTPEQRVALWEQVSALPEGQRAATQEKLVSLQAGVDPAEAADWLTSQPETPPSPELASRLAANWALDDAPAAARWVESLPAGETKTWALWNLARQWQRVDAAAAQRWAAGQPTATRTIMENAFTGQRP